MISVIIPGGTDPYLLGFARDGLDRQTYRDFEVIVGRQQGTDFRAAQARNWGARRSRGDALVFLDQDCIAGPHFLWLMHREIAMDRVVFAPRHRIRPEVAESCADFADLLEKAEPSDDAYPSSHAMGLTAVQFCRLGGFDEAYVGWGYEDLDLFHRLQVPATYLHDQIVHVEHALVPRDGLDHRKAMFEAAKLNPERVRNGGRLIRDHEPRMG